MHGTPPPGLGTRLVREILGAESAADLLGRHPFLSPYGQLTALIADAAFKVDDLDQRVQERTAHITRELESVRGGQSATTLGSASTEIALLSARRDQSADHLRTMAGAYRRSLANDTGHAPAQVQGLGQVSRAEAAISRTPGGPPSAVPPVPPITGLPTTTARRTR
ncbi:MULTISPECIES: hypothetical protein [Streptomyces]|uniref:Uncharacterized protein n=1 Tax=Streptomyces tsukubensis (strain DSM 42081 / NBRC 108919 / NRRL 18488 / 9993) TaxID=1114943 RepID=I2N6I4_STRT9|nr:MULTISPECIES: hypothetical protein [Streptomyces]AZK96623.1 hypothetical protein B7R87_24220 [Streptomyces tsukubensis]EIF92631.1 hypothetical protein [Streptomyces tsukubensis NRRL18488]MYS67837.1 hypothetical protein [Streptomyces sp. SID5473]QKM67374.1 hypothetical protein STSU_009545 [Streptomyces tsukubensis NRRL18488]TAI42077.1 hypothetical protein EWI31_24405 [Streptomyces tsukubensis]